MKCFYKESKDFERSQKLRHVLKMISNDFERFEKFRNVYKNTRGSTRCPVTVGSGTREGRRHCPDNDDVKHNLGPEVALLLLPLQPLLLLLLLEYYNRNHMRGGACSRERAAECGG